MFRSFAGIGIAALILSVGPARAQEYKPREFDWPQWQGPQRTAICKETGLLQSWPEGGPKILWQVENLGKGYSTPSIAAGRILIMGHAEDEDYVFCLKEKDGSLLWKQSLGSLKGRGRVGRMGARCTPTVDGDRLYALGVFGDLACLNVADGKILWKKDLREDFKGRRGGWGYAESPLIDGEKVLVTPGGSEATIVALDKMSGSLIWKCPIEEGYSAGYSSIIVAEVDGLRQYIQFLGRGRGDNASKGAVVGVRAKDGKFLWSFSDAGNRTANITTPVFQKNQVFATSAYGTGGALAELKRDGENTSAKVVYFTKDFQNHHGGMILLGDHLYGNNRGELVCLHFQTGKVAWKSRKPGKGAILYADQRLYYRDERNGNVYLIGATPEEYKQHGVLEQPNRSGDRAWAHPVIANGRLYIADQSVLICYDVKKK